MGHVTRVDIWIHGEKILELKPNNKNFYSKCIVDNNKSPGIRQKFYFINYSSDSDWSTAYQTYDRQRLKRHHP